MIFSSAVPSNRRTSVALQDYLAQRFTYFSRDQWALRIISGKVLINDKTAHAGDTVSADDVIAYDAGEFEEPTADLGYRIVYEDEWLLGIDKPGNLLVHRAGRSFRNNLMHQLRVVHVPPYAEAQAVHRLDRDTSGVLLIAKNASICAAIGNDIGTGKVQKIYCAVVTGSPVPQEIDKPLGKDIHSAISYKFRVDQNGKPAVTHIIACQTVGEHHALVTLQPVTGRTHQIRLHLAAIGAPIVGDKLYGLTEEEYVQWRNDQSLFSGKLGFHRHALHCESLTFIHPITKKEIFISAEIPADMQGLITRLSATQ